MLNSMTGYGSAQRAEGDFVIEVEARSVNNRFLKVNFRAPEPFSKSQKLFEDLVKERVSRGTVDLGIRLFRGKTTGAPTIQEAILQSYYQQLADLKKKLNIPGKVDLSLLLSLPGTVESNVVIEDEGLAERLTQVAAEGAREAVERLGQMRRDEGAALEKELKGMLDDLERHAEQVEARRPELLKDYRSRLQSRVQELLQGTDVQVSEGDLARELALFAERSDIAEELQRLRSHAAQFREACEREEAVGRRLEFMAQEMHREVNTMGAKASDSSLATIVIEMKGLVDRLKEQVMNVE
jgi:uncharacterized protein (TIGR00255 family)